MICDKKHRYDDIFKSLPDAQDDQNGGRHICAGCAYEAGLKDGAAGVRARTSLSGLPYSQAGTVRHKNAYEAYLRGYKDGEKRRPQ